MSLAENPGAPPTFLGRVARVNSSSRKPSPRPEAGANKGALGTGVLLAAVFILLVYRIGGSVLAAASVLGLALGFTLFHSRFGFSSAWRQVVAAGQTASLRAHMLMLATATVLFALILGNGWGLHAGTSGLVQPVGVALVAGSFLFGLGMQVGGSCSSGTLFAVGSGQTGIVGTLLGFIVGSVLAAASYPFWFGTIPAGPSISLAALWGYPVALAVSLAAMAAIVAGSYLLADRRQPPPVQEPPSATGPARLLRGSWALWAGALALAALNGAVLVVTGRPWGVTTAFGLWGAKLLHVVGVPVERWRFWRIPANAGQLHGSVLADRVSVLDLGIMIGALVASSAAGAWTFHRRVPWRTALGSLLGGVAMGYGAQLAGGCNIGAYFSGIASFSLHGWIWGVSALLGTWFGLRLRPLFGLPNPKPSDAVC
jgi:uncharacterized protein